MVPSSSATVTVVPARRVGGRVVLPGDKSISHRYALLAALADGQTRIRHYAPGADCAATLLCLRELGVDVARDGQHVTIAGRGVGRLAAPDRVLDAGNSGSTLRMLAGILAGHAFRSTLTGDDSLRRRPMRRIITPLERMGARLEAEADRPPLTIHGGALTAIDYAPDVPSAQVKSAVLFAGLHARGTTRVREAAVTRDHTELALAAFGARVDVDGTAVSLEGGQALHAADLQVPGDVSSATFWLCAAAALPGSAIELDGVGLNPTRTAILDVVRRLGARIEATVTDRLAGEPVGRILVAHGRHAALEIGPGEVPGLIDELPALAALATFGGRLRVTGAAELRAKESDRITALVAGLRALGADADELPDGFDVRGTRPLAGGTADACGDHRLAMAFAIAALGAEGPSDIVGAEAIDVSYPGFFDTLDAIRG